MTEARNEPHNPRAAGFFPLPSIVAGAYFKTKRFRVEWETDRSMARVSTLQQSRPVACAIIERLTAAVIEGEVGFARRVIQGMADG